MKIVCDTCFSPSHLFNFMEACRSWWVDLGGLTGRIEFTVVFWDISIMDVLHLAGEYRQISLPRGSILEPLYYPRLLNPVFKVTSGHTTREVPVDVAGRWLGKESCYTCSRHSWWDHQLSARPWCLSWAASLGRSVPDGSQSTVLAKIWSVSLHLCQAGIKHSWEQLFLSLWYCVIIVLCVISGSF